MSMEIGDIIYLEEPIRWRLTPDGNWNEHLYPAGTPVKIIGKGERGLDVEFIETGVRMEECRFVKFTQRK